MPTLLLLSGPPGVGKSTLSKAIATHLDYFIIDKDCLDEQFSPNSRDQKYSDNIEPKVLQAVLDLALLNLSLNKSVILDVPWTHIFINSPDWKTKIEKLVQETLSNLRCIECFLTEEQLKQRLTDRGLQRDQGKLSVDGWEQFKKSDHISARISLEHLALNMANPRAQSLERALAYLSASPIKPNAEKIGWKPISTRVAYQGKRFNLIEDQVVIESKETKIFTMMDHPGSVYVVPQTPDGKIILIRQYRYSVDKFFWEIPAGHMDKPEMSPVEIAREELLEEIGASASNWSDLGKYYCGLGHARRLC